MAGDDLSEWERLGTTPLTVAQIPTWGYYRVRAVATLYISLHGRGYATTDAVLGGPNDMGGIHTMPAGT